MKLATVILFFASALSQDINSIDERGECLRGQGPAVMQPGPRDCCRIGRLFNISIVMECDEKTPGSKIHAGNPSMPSCAVITCIFKKHGLLQSPGEGVNIDAMKEFLSKWSMSAPEFNRLLNKVENVCLSFERSEVCPALRFMTCITTFVYTECPHWDNSKEHCVMLKNHLIKCKQFFEENAMIIPEITAHA